MALWRVFVCVAALSTVFASAETAMAADTLVASQVRFAGERGYRVVTMVSPRGKPRIVVQAVNASLEPVGKSIDLPGGAATTALAVRDDAVMVALLGGGGQPRVRMALLPVAADGSLKGPAKLVDATARRTDKTFSPTTVLACPDGDGFAILWQEIKVRQNGRPDARTYMARVAPDGRWLMPAVVVSVPWALGEMVYNGAGYHLAIFFDGAQPGQTRVSMVTLDAAGKPEQHPWWVSQPELVDEVQLIRIGGGVHAYWRGGTDSTSLRSVKVTSARQWGQAPEAHTDHGRLRLGDDFALRLDASRKVEVIR